MSVAFDNEKYKNREGYTSDKAHQPKNGLIFRMYYEIMTEHIEPHSDGKMVDGHGYDSDPLKSGTGKSVCSCSFLIMHRQRDISILSCVIAKNREKL